MESADDFFRRCVPQWVRRTSFDADGFLGPWRVEVSGASGGVWTLVPSRSQVSFGSTRGTPSAGTLTCRERGLWFLHTGLVLEGHMRNFLSFDGPVEELESLALFFQRGSKDNWCSRSPLGLEPQRSVS